MSECPYCGNEHAPAELCRARRVNRRAFFGVFAAVGVAAVAAGSMPRTVTNKVRLAWDDSEPRVLGAQSGMDMSGEAFVAYYMITRMPDGARVGRWIEVDDDGHLLIPARDLALSGHYRSARLTSIPTRD